jgi:hypothetical protein
VCVGLVAWLQERPGATAINLAGWLGRRLRTGGSWDHLLAAGTTIPYGVIHVLPYASRVQSITPYA